MLIKRLLEAEAADTKNEHDVGKAVDDGGAAHAP
jgi:hypothetical protein